jgi:hypothetical protein
MAQYTRLVAIHWQVILAAMTLNEGLQDARISEYLKAQTERSAHMQTRIAHFNIEVHVGMSVPDAIQAVASQRPR